MKIFLLALIVTYSCSNKNTIDENIKSLKLIETGKTINMSDIIENIDYTFLKFNNHNMAVGEIVNIKIIDNDILVLQRVGNITMFQRFSDSGNYLNEIGDYGRGANEIYNPRDITLYNNNYIVWDYNGVHEISKRGKYVRYLFKAQIPGSRFFINSNHLYFLHELTYPGFLSKYSLTGNLKKIYLPNSYNFGNLNYANINYLTKDSFHITSPLVDTVYSFCNDKLNGVYKFDSGKNKTFQEVLFESKKMHPLEQLKYINKTKPLTIKSYLENSDNIFVTYLLNSKINYLLIRKKKDEILYFDTCNNNIDGGIWGTPVFLTENNVLYIPIYPHNLIKKSPLKSYDSSNKINNLKIDDNPFFMLCKLKD